MNNNENLQFNLKDEIEEVNLYQKVSDSVVTWVKDEIAYVSIAQFWSEWELGEVQIEILHQFFEENKGAEHIIIDIQGNPGGNTEVWERGIILPLWQEPLENYTIMGMLSGDLNRFFWPGDLPDISDLDEFYSADDLTGQFLFPEFEITNVDEMVYIKSSVRIENRPKEAVGFDGTVNGIIGTPPDIEVQEGQTALEVVLEEISKLRSLP